MILPLISSPILLEKTSVTDSPGAGALCATKREPIGRGVSPAGDPSEVYLRTMSNAESNDTTSGMENTAFFKRFVLGSMP